MNTQSSRPAEGHMLAHGPTTVAGNAAVLAAVASRRSLRAVRSNLFIASMGELDFF